MKLMQSSQIYNAISLLKEVRDLLSEIRDLLKERSDRHE